MGVGPPGTGCRISPQTAGRCVGMRSQVVSGPEKAGRTRQVGPRKTNESEPLMRRRDFLNVVETRLLHHAWDQARQEPVYGPGGDRRRGGVSLGQAFKWNVGTWRPDAKGETQGATIPRGRVPMQGAGADRFVVALNSGNAGGAKGPNRPTSCMGQPARGGAHG